MISARSHARVSAGAWPTASASCLSVTSRSVCPASRVKIESAGSSAAHFRSTAARRRSVQSEPVLRRSFSSNCHLSSHSRRDACSRIVSRPSSSAWRTVATSARACPHIAMMLRVERSGHAGSPDVSVPYTVAAAAYTSPRKVTCICHAVVVPPVSNGSGAARVRSCDTVCMASTGSASVSGSSASFKSISAMSACSSSHSSMLVVPSFKACGTSMRLASPTITCSLRYSSVLCDSSLVLMIGRSNVVCKPTFI